MDAANRSFPCQLQEKPVGLHLLLINIVLIHLVTCKLP